MNAAQFLLGVDGGGTQCRARLTDFIGATLGAERLAREAAAALAAEA